MNKNELRRALVSKRVSIAELSRQTGVSRYSIKAFRDTGKINPATLAALLMNAEPIERKGEND